MGTTFNVEGVTITDSEWSVIYIGTVCNLPHMPAGKYVKVSVIGSHGGFQYTLIPISEFRARFRKGAHYIFNHARFRALLNLSGGAFFDDMALACIDEG